MTDLTTDDELLMLLDQDKTPLVQAWERAGGGTGRCIGSLTSPWGVRFRVQGLERWFFSHELTILQESVVNGAYLSDEEAADALHFADEAADQHSDEWHEGMSRTLRAAGLRLVREVKK